MRRRLRRLRLSDVSAMLSRELVSVVAMLLGFLIQNFAEWRAGGPHLPEAAAVQRIFPEESSQTRVLALLIISIFVVGLSVVGLCLMSLLTGWTWVLVATGAALALNAVAQVIASLRARCMHPGTLTGLLLMLPPALWVVVVFGSGPGWSPIVAGAVLSVPVLLCIWWRAELIRRVTSGL